ncbi:MAG: serine hydrolase [Calothrix sp. MO_167.B12]|nr:serine hydrolase [Calothrix sp. MO_167.B12]
MKSNKHNQPWYISFTSVTLGLTLPILGLSHINGNSVLAASQASPQISSKSSVINVNQLQKNNRNLIALAEQSSTKPTQFWWLHGASVSQIKSKVNDGYRIIDLEIESSSPLKFSAAMVKNQGEYAKKWWWYYGLNSEQVKQKLTANKARIIDLEIYRVNGEKKYAVALVSNTGNNAKGWWYYSDTSIDNIIEKTKANKARIVDLNTYMVGGKRLYSAVMIKNTGNDQKAWWYYYNVSPSFITSKLKENKARLVDIEPHGTNKFTVVMEKSQGQSWWWYYGKTEDQVNQLWQKNQARIFDIEPYTVNGKKRFAVLMLNNANQLTSRIRRLLANNQSGGAYGLYLKQVNGKILASLQRDRIFEPASTIKALHHVHAMMQVRDGKVNLNTQIPWYKKSTNDEKPGNGCPLDQVAAKDTLAVGLKAMMEQSDNRWTQAMRVYFGENKLNATAKSLGMSKTLLQHKIGCASGTDGAISEPNRLTLTDIGKLYEAVANGLLKTEARKEKFYELMTDNLREIDDVINEEAQKLNLNNTAIQSFKKQVRTAAKAGSYTLNSKKYKTIGGWVRLPFKQGSTIKTQEYVFGLFIDKANTIKDGFGIWPARAELLRDEIRKSLMTFK